MRQLLVSLHDHFAETSFAERVACRRKIGGIPDRTDEHAIELRIPGFGNCVRPEAFLVKNIGYGFGFIRAHSRHLQKGLSPLWMKSIGSGRRSALKLLRWLVAIQVGGQFALLRLPRSKRFWGVLGASEALEVRHSRTNLPAPLVFRLQWRLWLLRRSLPSACQENHGPPCNPR